MTIQPLHRIRDLILPLLVNGTNMREMLATVIHYNNLDPDEGVIHRSLAELEEMGYVICRDDETGRWWLETPEGAA